MSLIEFMHCSRNIQQGIKGEIVFLLQRQQYTSLPFSFSQICNFNIRIGADSFTWYLKQRHCFSMITQINLTKNCYQLQGDFICLDYLVVLHNCLRQQKLSLLLWLLLIEVQGCQLRHCCLILQQLLKTNNCITFSKQIKVEKTVPDSTLFDFLLPCTLFQWRLNDRNLLYC